MMNSYGDLPANVVMDTGAFKAMTGEDTVEGERKFEKAVNFYNNAKLVFSANSIPMLKSDDDAFYNRWVIFPFKRSYLGNEDESIEKGITSSPEELSGILNLALNGISRLEKNKWHMTYKFDAAGLYKRASNPIAAFLEDEYEATACNQFFVTKKELLEAYKVYALKYKLPIPGSTNAFNKMIKNNTTIPVSEYTHTFRKNDKKVLCVNHAKVPMKCISWM